MTDNTPLLEIKDLNISYYTRAGEIPAVIDFSLTVNAGESVGLVLFIGRQRNRDAGGHQGPLLRRDAQLPLDGGVQVEARGALRRPRR